MEAEKLTGPASNCSHSIPLSCATLITIPRCRAGGRKGQQYLRQGRHYTDKDAARNILANPFKPFENMQMFRHTKTLGVVEVDGAVWKNLSREEKTEIERICDRKPDEYTSGGEDRDIAIKGGTNYEIVWKFRSGEIL